MGPPAGLYLGAAILVTDVAANAYATCALTGSTSVPAVPVVLGGLAALSLVALRPVRRWM